MSETDGHELSAVQVQCSRCGRPTSSGTFIFDSAGGLIGVRCPQCASLEIESQATKKRESEIIDLLKEIRDLLKSRL